MFGNLGFGWFLDWGRLVERVLLGQDVGFLRSYLERQFGDYCLGIGTAEVAGVEVVVEVVEAGCGVLAWVVEWFVDVGGSC